MNFKRTALLAASLLLFPFAIANARADVWKNDPSIAVNRAYAFNYCTFQQGIVTEKEFFDNFNNYARQHLTASQIHNLLDRKLSYSYIENSGGCYEMTAPLRR